MVFSVEHVNWASEYSQRLSLFHPQTELRADLCRWTDVSLGDCSYLDQCRTMATCRAVHYELDLTQEQRAKLKRMGAPRVVLRVIGTCLTHRERRPGVSNKLVNS